MYLSAPFIPQNFKKKSYSQSTFMRMHEFCAQNGPFAPIFFFGKHWYYFHLPIGPFHCASFKKIITTDSWWSYDNLLFLSPKWPICPNENFFSENLLLRIVPFIHATCLCPDAMQYKRAMCIIAKCLVRLNSMKMPPNY